MHTIECMHLELNAIAHDRMHLRAIARKRTGVNKPAPQMFLDDCNGESICVIIPYIK